jgi:hypothetical protein
MMPLLFLRLFLVTTLLVCFVAVVSATKSNNNDVHEEPSLETKLLTTPKQLAAKRILKALQPVVNGKQQAIEEGENWDMDLLMEDVKLVFEKPTPKQLAAMRIVKALQPLVDAQQEDLEVETWNTNSLVMKDLKSLFELKFDDGEEEVEQEQSTSAQQSSDLSPTEAPVATIRQSADHIDYLKERNYGDRFILRMLDAWNDPDCMSDEGLDYTSSNFTTQQAVDVFHKCRLLVVRNVFPQTHLEDYKRKVTHFVKGIATGRISEQGTTSFGAGEPYYWAENAEHRFDLCFTEDLIDTTIMFHPTLLGILSHPLVLDSDMQMLDFGAILAEPNAPLQDWHRDGGEVRSK